MPDRMKDKVVLITGAAQGIGEATALLMGAEGASVILADRNVEKAKDVAALIAAKGGAAHVVAVDMGDRESVKEMVDRSMALTGRIDALVNNAAAVYLDARDVNIVDADLEVWDEIIDVNLNGPMLASRHVIPHMIEQGGGSIVMVASMSYRLASGNRPGYDVTKAAVVQLARSIAVAFGKRNIRSNVVAPGLTLSPSVLAQIPAAMREVYLGHTMTPSIGEPADQAAAILFLASDESRYVNGAVLDVDGGLGAHVPVVPGLLKLQAAD